jgi:hypothetical protein
VAVGLKRMQQMKQMTMTTRQNKMKLDPAEEHFYLGPVEQQKLLSRSFL